MNTAAERNAPCPCGSGKKFKNCCMAKKAVASNRSRSAATGFIILILAFAAGAMIIKSLQSPEPAPVSVAPAAMPIAPGGLQPQPPGPVPEGKVWSPEHGHWHDVQAGDDAGHQVNPINMPAARTGLNPGPPPPGPAPEGKEWSYEHGHWHNIPGYVGSKTEVKPATVDEPAAAEGEKAGNLVDDATAVETTGDSAE